MEERENQLKFAGIRSRDSRGAEDSCKISDREGTHLVCPLRVARLNRSE